MTYGNDLLREIERRSLNARHRATSVAQQISNVRVQQVEKKIEKSKALKEFARRSLMGIQVQRFITRLAPLQDEVAAGLAKYTSQRDEIFNGVAIVEADEKEAFGALEKCGSRLTELLLAFHERQHALRSRLTGDAKWSDLRDAAKAHTELAARSTHKAESVAQRNELLKRPYLQNPLTRYLIGRHYETPSYSANAITAKLDRWVADVCGYTVTGLYLRQLDEITAFFWQNAEHHKQAAELAGITAKTREERHLVADGLSDLEEEVAIAETKRDHALNTLRRAKVQSACWSNQIDAIASGSDHESAAAFRACAEMLADGDLAALLEMTEKGAGQKDGLNMVTVFDAEVELLEEEEKRMFSEFLNARAESTMLDNILEQCIACGCHRRDVRFSTELEPVKLLLKYLTSQGTNQEIFGLFENCSAGRIAGAY